MYLSIHMHIHSFNQLPTHPQTQTKNELSCVSSDIPKSCNTDLVTGLSTFSPSQPAGELGQSYKLAKGDATLKGLGVRSGAMPCLLQTGLFLLLCSMRKCYWCCFYLLHLKSGKRVKRHGQLRGYHSLFLLCTFQIISGTKLVLFTYLCTSQCSYMAHSPNTHVYACTSNIHACLSYTHQTTLR